METISQKEFQKLFHMVREQHLGETTLFVHDGVLGSHKSSEVKIRVISDNANVALFMRNMLPVIPLDPVEKYQPKLVVYIAPHFKHSNFEGCFTIFHPSEKALVICGTHSLSALRSILLKYAGSQSESKPLLLRSDSVINQNGELSLIISSHPDLFLAKKLKNSESNANTHLKLFGAHHHFWNQKGIVRVWNGVDLPYEDPVSLKKGDLVEMLPDKSNRTITPLNSDAPNIANHPTSIIFLVEDSQGVSPTIAKLSPIQAVRYFLSEYERNPSFNSSGEPAMQLANSLQQMIEANNVTAYFLNASGQSDSKLNFIIGSTLDGTIQTAQLSKEIEDKLCSS